MATCRYFDIIGIMKTDNAVRALSALAQESRLAIFRLLVQSGPAGLAAGAIAEKLGLSPATLSFHLTQLSNAGLAKSRHEGRFIYYSADFLEMNSLVAFLTENCCGGNSCGPGQRAVRAARKRAKT